MDKETKKRLQNQYKEKQKMLFIDSLPMSVDAFAQLFDYLDNTMDDCDNSLTHTITFLKENGYPVDPVTKWLLDNGGGCDCEVLDNVLEQFEELNLL